MLIDCLGPRNVMYKAEIGGKTGQVDWDWRVLNGHKHKLEGTETFNSSFRQ
jgi:hypothetical protein